MSLVTFTCSTVQVYQVPPPSGKGLRTTQIIQPSIFTGSLRLVQSLDPLKLDIRIEVPITPGEQPASERELFAACPYAHANTVERTTDSSRFFQLRVVHEKRVAYLAIGFEEKDLAFDFQVALADFDKLKRTAEARQVGARAPEQMSKAMPAVKSFEETGDIPLLAPPPSTSAMRETQAATTTGFDDDFGDFQ